MQIQHLEHKHGGRITELTAIAHDTYKKQTSWHFVGRVVWNDGTVSETTEISPVCVCVDHDNPEAKAECNAVMQRLTDYLHDNGAWAEQGCGWIPKAKKGREALS